ncbi:hypothetical protein DITRI_Ditri01bG0042700 [Diplodiscus trichospermus]
MDGRERKPLVSRVANYGIQVYIPGSLLDVFPQRLNQRPPSYYGHDDLETLMASVSAVDWTRICEMLLGKVPDGFKFAPKHGSNAYDQKMAKFMLFHFTLMSIFMEFIRHHIKDEIFIQIQINDACLPLPR